MAVRNVRVCDVFGATKEVKGYAVELKVYESGQAGETLLEKEVDLSPRGLKRLKKFIERGTTAPDKRS